MGKFDGCCIWREPGAVNCYYADRVFCYKCGWNPAVEDERKERIRTEMGYVQTPKRKRETDD